MQSVMQGEFREMGMMQIEGIRPLLPIPSRDGLLAARQVFTTGC
jgi:hypothetical protein